MESRRRRPPARFCASPDTTRSREKTDYWQRLLHSSREKARYRSVSNKMKTFIRLTPQLKGKTMTTSARFRKAFRYLLYLEKFIQGECAAQKIPLPPMCDRLTQWLREHPWEAEEQEGEEEEEQKEGEEVESSSTAIHDQEASESSKTRSKPACSARNRTPRSSPAPQPLQDELSLTDDEAVVPAYTNLVLPKQATREWELYGISEEDWMAAGSSQAGSSQQQTLPSPPLPPPQRHQEEEELPRVASKSEVTKTYVELTCEEAPTSGHPMVDAPAYFVVTSSGDVVAVGELPPPQLGGPPHLDS